MKHLFIIIVAILAFTSCNHSGSTNTGYYPSSSSSDRPKSPEELKMELEQIEQSNPTDYLTADGTYKQNFWGDKFKVKCTITNNATIATFKDALIRVTYYSKTNTVLGTTDDTVYEVFPPSSSKTVEMKINNYKDVNSIGWEVISATAIR